jgi:gas vesicle protein GvpO
MAEDVREQRAAARERRRSLAAKPFEQLDEAAREEPGSTPLAAAKGVAATAAAAAIAGALAGAAKALLDRSSTAEDEAQDGEPRAEERSEDEGPAAAEPQPEQRDQDDEPSEDEPEAERDEDEPQAAPPTAEAREESSDDDAEPEQLAEQANQPSSEHDEDGSDGGDGAPRSDAIHIVEQAREHLKNLLGADAESVSGIERANGNWSVTLEVVELHRIPESTDILSSYSAVLDDDGAIVSLTRGRRYRRSQVEET